MTFEEGTSRLEQICEKLQQPSVGIAEAGELFSEGMQIVIRLEKELKTVHHKVETLLKKADAATPSSPETEPDRSGNELFPELRAMLKPQNPAPNLTEEEE